MSKKIFLIVFIAFPLVWLSRDVSARRGEKREQRSRTEVRERHETRGPQGHEHQEKHRKHEKIGQRMDEKIAAQHERKMQHLERWKGKKLEKCGNDQTCTDRVNRIYDKRKAQIDDAAR